MGIFHVEVYAVGRCPLFNLGRRYKRKNKAILSDSQALIRSLGSYEVKLSCGSLGGETSTPLSWSKCFCGMISKIQKAML